MMGLSSSPECGGAGEDAPISVSASFFDAGALDTHTATVSWGDGTSEAVAINEADGAGTLFAQHVYAQGGTYTITLTLLDDDGGVATATAQAVVSGVVARNGVLQVIGTGKADRMAINKSANGRYVVNASFLTARVRSFPVAAVKRIEAHMCQGDDAVVVGPGVALPSRIDGGGGKDALTGGGGSNVLVGGAGNDALVGGLGRDVLIGGLGADRLLGQGGEDLLLANRTAHDDNAAALDAILREWGRRDLGYAVRHAHLTTGGGLNGAALLNASTVLDDRAADYLLAGAGRDGVFLTLGDVAAGLALNEAVTRSKRA
jgi:Ca2+-binding RTX toxin-like protein